MKKSGSYYASRMARFFVAHLPNGYISQGFRSGKMEQSAPKGRGGVALNTETQLGDLGNIEVVRQFVNDSSGSGPVYCLLPARRILPVASSQHLVQVRIVIP